MTASPVSVASVGVAETEPRVRHAVLLTAAPFCRRCFRVAFVFLAARALGPALFGSYALLVAILEMVAVASGGGYIDYVTREISKEDSLGWRFTWQVVALRCGYSLPFSVIAIAVLWVLGNPRTVLVSGALLFATLLPRAVAECVQGALRAVNRYSEFLAIDVAGGLVLVIGGVLLLIRGGGLTAIVFVEVCSYAIAALFALGCTAMCPIVGTATVGWRTLARKSSVFNVYQLVVNLYDRIDIILLSMLAGSVATGVYTVAYRAMNSVQVIPYGVLYSLLPSLSRNQSGKGFESLERAMGLLVFIALAAILAVTAFAPAVFQLILGPGYAGSAMALRILIWAEIVMCVNFGLNVALLAHRQERVFVMTSALCLAVNVAGNLLLIPKYSWVAAAALTIVTELALFAQNVFWIRRYLKTVPVPIGLSRILPVFAILYAILMIGGHFWSPVIVGSLCAAAFMAYAAQSGLLAEYRRAWLMENV